MSAAVATPWAEDIAPIDQRDAGWAAQIHALWRDSSVQEARVVGATAAGPVPGVEAIRASRAHFSGAFEQGRLVGAVAVGPDDDAGQLAITLLAVQPGQQRRGIGRALVQTVLARAPGAAFAVATTAGNGPALALYEGLGFVAYRRGEIGGAGAPGAKALALVKLRRVPTRPADAP